MNPFQQLEKEMKSQKVSSCLIYQNGKNIFEYYKNRKTTLKLAKVNSVTKSFISILVGIAIDRGDITSVHVPIHHYFPNMDSEKQSITIEHLLTMTPGIQWGEFGDWGGRPFPMINSKDWVKFVLEKPVEYPPGEEMAYNSGCSHLLSAIIQQATNMKVTDFAEKFFFKPLGIKEYRWYEDAKGIVIGGFGLCLKPEDLLKVGVLMLNNGTWNGQNVVSKEWVIQSTLPRYKTYNEIGAYGYHWWGLQG